MALLLKDLRFAVRSLLRNPGFTVVAAAAIALGIGANTAIFTVVDSILLRPLDFPESSRLYVLQRQFKNGSSPTLSPTKFSFFRRTARVFEEVAAWDVIGSGQNLTGAGTPERVPSLHASSGMWRVLGVAPMLGRSIQPDEDRPGGANVAVISHGLWQRRFGGDPKVLNSVIRLGGESYTIVGIMGPGFDMYPKAEVWTPLRAVETADDRANRYLVVGRLKVGVSIEQARADMLRVSALMRAQLPAIMDSPEETASLALLQELLTGPLRTPLMVLLAAVGFVLLIACANVANLLLARATGRAREIAIRAALGAGRARLVRQMLTESVVLSLTGGALGLILARLAITGLLALGADQLPRAAEIHINIAVMLFAFLVSLITGLLFGLAPAWQTGRTDINDSLRDSSGRVTAGQRRGLLRGLLVGAEVALAVVLLTGALLLLRSFNNLGHVAPGFDSGNVLTFQMSLGHDYLKSTDAYEAFTRKTLQKLESIPGVESAASVTSLPTEMGPDMEVRLMGGDGSLTDAYWRHITPHYFDTMRIAARRGRVFTEADRAGSEPVVIVNETFVKQVLRGKDPLTASLHIGPTAGAQFAEGPRRIVGVVADTHEEGLNKPASPVVFVPAAQLNQGFMEMLFSVIPSVWVVRTHAAPMTYSHALRQALLEVDPEQAVANVRPMEAVVRNSTAQQRMSTVLISVFAGIALILAGLGVYGILAYAITQRTSEIGLRVALGANRGQVLSLVLGKALPPALAGLAIGVAGSLALSRFLATLLFGVSVRDPLSFAIVPLVLFFICILASLFPAIRALRVDPIVALRYE